MSTETVLDLPVPPSVNRTRRVDWAGRADVKRWMMRADQLVTIFRSLKGNVRMDGQFEATIILSEAHTKMDADNAIKSVIDYARRLELIKDDSPKFMRKITVEWGHAPHGCRLVLKPFVPRETSEPQ
jgi:Holliday junction resolvase RusA-like endonuclease